MLAAAGSQRALPAVASAVVRAWPLHVQVDVLPPEFARLGLADSDGQFEQALSDLDQLPDPSAELRGEILRLKGHVYRVNGLFDAAEVHYREALDLARETASIAAEGKALTDLVQTLAWWPYAAGCAKYAPKFLYLRGSASQEFSDHLDRLRFRRPPRRMTPS
jgi:tetratricopeptide (TPR) repeat protein